jgi:hypothetical protein
MHGSCHISLAFHHSIFIQPLEGSFHPTDQLYIKKNFKKRNPKKRNLKKEKGKGKKASKNNKSK